MGAFELILDPEGKPVGRATVATALDAATEYEREAAELEPTDPWRASRLRRHAGKIRVALARRDYGRIVDHDLVEPEVDGDFDGYCFSVVRIRPRPPRPVTPRCAVLRPMRASRGRRRHRRNPRASPSSDSDSEPPHDHHLADDPRSPEAAR